MPHLIAFLLVLPILLIIAANQSKKQKQFAEWGVQRALGIARFQGWVSPHRLSTQCHMTRSNALFVLREATKLGILYQAQDGRYYCTDRSFHTSPGNSTSGRKPEANKAENPAKGKAKAIPEADILEDSALVERCINIALTTAFMTGSFSKSSLSIVGVNQRNAIRVLEYAVTRGDLIRGDNGLYYPSAAKKAEHERKQGKAQDREHKKSYGQSDHAATGEVRKYVDAMRILGVQNDTPRDVVERVWKDNLKRNHPDLGGSTWIAQQVNEAWDIIRHHNGWD